LLKPVSITQSAGVIRELRPKVVTALKHLEKKALEHVTSLKADARTRVSQELTHEAQRLEALGQRNGSVRSDEITTVRSLEHDTLEALNRAEPRLQGIRLIVAT
jgi:hypothetical protein